MANLPEDDKLLSSKKDPRKISDEFSDWLGEQRERLDEIARLERKARKTKERARAIIRVAFIAAWILGISWIGGGPLWAGIAVALICDSCMGLWHRVFDLTEHVAAIDSAVEKLQIDYIKDKSASTVEAAKTKEAFEALSILSKERDDERN